MLQLLQTLGSILGVWYQLIGNQGGLPVATPVPMSPVPTRTMTSTLTPRATNTPPSTATATQPIPATATLTVRPTNTVLIAATQTPVVAATDRPATRTTTPTNTLRPTYSPSPSVTRTPTSTASQTRTPSSTRTDTRTITATPTATATRTSTTTPTFTPTRTPTTTPTNTPTTTFTPTQTPTRTLTITRTPTLTPTLTWTPTQTATVTVTSTRTVTRTPTATLPPSQTPTASSTRPPTPTQVPHAVDPLGILAVGESPFQKLPSAILVFPLVRVSTTSDTRIEIMNLTASPVRVHCFYLQNVTCSETDFYIALTPQQPISWVAGTGMSGTGTRLAPPFRGDGELKCVNQPSGTDLASHNALQGRALLSDTSGTTVGYAAIAFRRLTPGAFSSSIQLDGFTYESCPDRLHFNALAQQVSTSDSELILVPCTEDLELGLPTQTTVQYAVINEFEQMFSGATQLSCMDRRRFSTVPALRKSSVGTDTMHMIVRGVDTPVVGLVIDRFFVSAGIESVSSNDPYLEGSRAATVNLPGE